MEEKETNYKAWHRSPSDLNDHVTLFGADGTVAGHAYRDGSRKTFLDRDQK